MPRPDTSPPTLPLTPAPGAPPVSWASGPVTARAHCVLAPNPGPMTLDGTNTWVLREPGSSQCVVVDPGPLDEAHLGRVLEVVRGPGGDGRVALTVLTHDHADHAAAAGRFAELSGAPLRSVRAVGTGHDHLAEGDRVTVAGLDLLVVATPGHTADSVCFLLPADAALLTGDTVLGRGTTVVAWPDGELAAYLASVQRLERICATEAVTTILPGHGPSLPDPVGILGYYLTHRAERLDQVRAALAAGAGTPRQVVEIVYADVPREVWEAAEWSVRAQWAYLQERGEVPRAAEPLSEPGA